MKLPAQLSLLVAILLVAGPATSLDEWEEAAAKIRRLGPFEYFKLPAEVLEFMTEVECQVPQPGRHTDVRPPVNVIAGEFARSGQTDWAMLCSIDGVSAIHILWGGDASCPQPISSRSDRKFLQNGGAHIRFSRQLFAISAEQIRGFYEYLSTTEEYEGSSFVPPVVTHDALDDAFLEKASNRHYCRDGSWETLAGPD